jgi:hypothetical protein
MKHAKLALSMSLTALLAASAQAAVYYVGTNDADPTSIVDLSVDPSATLGGEYDAATKTWKWLAADKYILQDQVFVTGGTLIIEEGSVVYGQPRTSTAVFDGGALIIARGAKLIAEGSPSAPIIFTTASSTGNNTSFGGRQTTGNQSPVFWDSAPLTTPQPNATAGLWGGVAILGNAPTNVDRDATGEQRFFEQHGAPATVSTDDRSSLEGVAVPSAANTAGLDRFGGLLSNENSGTLKYVSIRHGGSNLSANSEINGLTLGAVGAGTTIENVEIWGNTDDGVEVFGGTVNMKRIAVFNPQDDGLDLDAGYTGTVQFLLVVAGNLTDRLGEWDGSYETETVNGFSVVGPVTTNFLPLCNPTIANATFIGNLTVTTPVGSIANSRNSHNLHIRDQIAARLVNSIVYNHRSAAGTADGAYEVDNRAGTAPRTTVNRFQQGVAFLKGVTAYSNESGFGAAGTVANMVQRGSADATIEAIFGADASLTYNIDPGLDVSFLNANVSANSKLNLTPTNPQPAVVEDIATGNNATLVPAFYQGAFDSDPSAESWLNNWSAADAADVVTKNGFGGL